MSLPSAPQLEEQFSDVRPPQQGGLETRIATGVSEILKFQSVLLRLSLHYGQHGTMDHLEYFLGFEDAARKTPHLVLVGSNFTTVGVTAETLLGAVLVHEYRVLSLGTRVYATDDTSGRRTMVAPPDRRMIVARSAAAALLLAGCRLGVMSFIEVAPENSVWPTGLVPPRNRGWVRATQRRLIRSHLPLGATLDATLATLGQHTRRNLRYYRRRAETDLGCTFVPEVRISLAEFKAFNQECTYAVADERAGWRYDAVNRVAGMSLCGIKDRDGGWLSILCARHYYDVVEIDWQMNRDGMASASLSTVLRSYFMEQEIARGTKKLFLEGGTPHPMQQYFAMHLVRDVAFANSAWFVPLVQRCAPVLWKVLNRYLPKSNFLLQIITTQKLTWQPWS